MFLDGIKDDITFEEENQNGQSVDDNDIEDDEDDNSDEFLMRKNPWHKADYIGHNNSKINRSFLDKFSVCLVILKSLFRSYLRL